MNNTKHKLKLTYISSAITSFARASGIAESGKKIGMEKEYRSLMQDLLYRIDGYSVNCDHGTLWNALTEKGHKKILKGLNDPQRKQMIVMADSGGLQQITLGINVTDEGRKEIFRRQAEFSTHAMNFDEMPVLVNEALRDKFASQGNGDQGLKLNHSIKYFIKELRYDRGRESGFNIKEQIDIIIDFKKNNPEKEVTKVLTIIQGWDIEDYNEYARGVYSVFNEMEEAEREKYYEHIGGISLGTSGIISYFRMFDLYCRAPMDLTNVPERFRSFIHILGLGGNNKSGVLFALQDNFFGKEVHYTYDSTSLTAASTFGKHIILEEKTTYKKGEQITFMNQRSQQLGRDISDKTVDFMKEVQDEYADLLQLHLGDSKMSADDFRNKYSPWRDDGCAGLKSFEDKFDGKDGLIAREQYNNAISLNAYLHFALEAKTFMRLLDDMKRGDFNSISDNEYRKAMEKLFTIKTYDEYMKRRGEFKAILGYIPNPGSEEAEWYEKTNRPLENSNEKRKSTMTYCQTVEEFNEICRSSVIDPLDDFMGDEDPTENIEKITREYENSIDIPVKLTASQRVKAAADIILSRHNLDPEEW